MKYEIRRLDVLTTAKTFAALYAAIGLIFGIIYMFLVLVAGAASILFSPEAIFPWLGAGMLSWVIFTVLSVLFYIVIGAIFGALAAFVYNFLSGNIGGFEFELKELNSAKKKKRK